MESKYREHIIRLLETHPEFDKFCSVFHVDEIPPFIIEVMCQLAEEIEKETEKNTKKIYVDFITAMTNGTLFTREKVEEILEKQRELSADKAEAYCSYPAGNNPVSTMKVYVIRESILNAKYIIE